MPKESSGYDTTLIGDEQITWTQVAANISEVSVLESLRGTMNNEQARGIAWLNRCLCNQFLRKIIVKVANS
jgi:hypothetical protein